MHVLANRAGSFLRPSIINHLTTRIYVQNCSKEDADFFGYRHDENGYFYIYREQTEEEESEAFADYWAQFDSEQLFWECF